MHRNMVARAEMRAYSPGAAIAAATVQSFGREATPGFLVADEWREHWALPQNRRSFRLASLSQASQALF